MLIKDIMSRRLVKVTTNESVYSAIKKMVANNISGLVVVEKKKVAGIITMRDVCKRVIAQDKNVHKTEVGEAMSKPAMTIHPLSNVEKAADVMKQNSFKRLVVVDGKNRAIGIVTVMDIVSNLPALIDVMFNTWVKPSWK